MPVQIVDQLVAHITMLRGNTPTWKITVTDLETGAPFPLTGSKIWMTAKRNRDDADADAVFQITTDSGHVAIDAPPNDHIARIKPSPTSTSGLTSDVTLHYDIQIKPPGGDIFTPRYGNLIVTRDITRAVA